jgi:hypothetical protein
MTRGTCDAVALCQETGRRTHAQKPQAAYAGFWSCLFAAATTLSVVNPNFF